MSVENGVVISFLNKDYELQSWNEQGKITKIEGILTIAFLVVSLCSHRDRKELYLIMKIHYLVNMSLDNNLSQKNKLSDKEKIGRLAWAINSFTGIEFKNEYDELIEIFNDYKGKINKITELESKINNFGSENSLTKDKLQEVTKKIDQALEQYKTEKEEVEKLKKENLRLKIISGETKSGWIKERDWIYRLDHETGKPKGHRCPFDFKHEDVEKLVIYFNEDKGEKWADFEHPYPGYDLKSFDMPSTAYRWLKGELPEQKKKERKQIQKKDRLIKFDSPESLIQYFEENLGNEYYSHSLIDVFAPFVFENIKKQFGRKEACEYCKSKRGKKPCDATVHKHLNLLIKHNIILRKHKGMYEVNKQSINYD